MAKEIREEVKRGVDEWVACGKRHPHLSAVIVGDDPASQTYIKNKMSAAKSTGIMSYICLLYLKEISTNFIGLQAIT